MDYIPTAAFFEKDGVWKEYLTATKHFLFRILFRLSNELMYQFVKWHVCLSDEVSVKVDSFGLKSVLFLNLDLARWTLDSFLAFFDVFLLFWI